LYQAWRHNFLGLKDTVDAAWTAMQPFFHWIGSVFKMVSVLIQSIVLRLKSSIADWYQSWNNAFTGMKSPLMAFAGVVAYVVGFIVGIIRRIFTAVKPYILPLFHFLNVGFTGVFQIVTGILKTFLSVFTGVFRIIGSILKGDFSSSITAAKEMVKGMVSGMKTAFIGLWNLLKGVLGFIYTGFKLTFTGIWTLIKSVFSGIWSIIKNVFSFIWDGMNWVADGMISLGSTIFDFLTVPFVKGWELIESVFSGVNAFFTSAFSGVGNIISAMWLNIKTTLLSGFNWLVDKINGMLEAVNTVTGIVGIPAIPNIPKLAKGTANISQDTLAILHKGEAVIPAKQNPFHPATFTKNTFNQTRASQTSNIDRSIHISSITIQAGSGDPEDFKSKLMDVFEELAGKSEQVDVAIP
ncbi:MAG: hypothetical protein ACE5D1_08215, partial [Fidelibacterota bacterium]